MSKGFALTVVVVAVSCVCCLLCYCFSIPLRLISLSSWVSSFSVTDIQIGLRKRAQIANCLLQQACRLAGLIVKTMAHWYSFNLSSLDYEAVVKLSDGFNGADLRNVCTEAGKTFFHVKRPCLISYFGHD